MAFLTPQLIRFLARHFVNLVFFDRSPRIAAECGGAGRAHCASGFLVSVRGQVYLLTAGHILSQIEEALAAGQRLTDWALDDSCGWEARDPHPIPFDFPAAMRYHVDADGMDYGLVWLSSYYVRLLAANGAVAIGEESWERDWPGSFDRYALLGVPAERVRQVAGLPGTLDRDLTLLAVERINDESQVPPQLRHAAPRIFGRLPPPNPSASPLKSIVGMSGGPLFAFKLEGEQPRYWLIGVQAAWDERARVIAACPIQTLLRTMSRIVDEIADNSPEPPGGVDPIV